jgi:hypothetical protein
MPPSVDGPWDRSGIERRSTIRVRAPRALTVAANWGVSAAPDRPGPLGRGGVWSTEAREVEYRYGPDATLHVSLEEFARTLTSREENLERWREGGTRRRERDRRRSSTAFRREADQFHRAYRQFRGFDRPNVLHLYQTFRPSPAFRHEYPEAVQVGPIWPPTRRGGGPRPAERRSSWTWYASPASAANLVNAVDRGLRRSRVREVLVRSPRPIEFPADSSIRWTMASPMGSRAWRERFDSAGVRITTGSRTLLEALRLRRPFLYFNGTMAAGNRRRRHRPEKVQTLLAAWRAEGASPEVLRDLEDFSKGRRVADVVGRAATDPQWRRSFPRSSPVSGFGPERRDGGRFLVRVARTFARGALSSDVFVRSVRSAAKL